MGMEVKMDKLEYALAEQSNNSGESVLLTICENSDGSEDMITPDDRNAQYEVRATDGVFQYRVIDPLALSSDETQTNLINGASGISSQNTSMTGSNLSGSTQSDCQLYVINNVQATPVQAVTRPYLITPKVLPAGNQTSSSKHLLPSATRKRDERRRATHNEVERRRRDKINQWIFRLKDLLPENQDPKTKNNMGDSKGEILSKACEYIKELQEQISSLKECLHEADDIRLENTQLKEINEKLSNENERLKLQISHEKNTKNKLENDLVLENETSSSSS